MNDFQLVYKNQGLLAFIHRYPFTYEQEVKNIAALNKNK